MHGDLPLRDWGTRFLTLRFEEAALFLFLADCTNICFAFVQRDKSVGIFNKNRFYILFNREKII